MAGWKIGLDFGTHYTKVCVVDSSDKRNKIYRFQKFKDQNGDYQFVIPSVVQLNKDRTLSYGYVDNDNALIVKGLPEKDPPQKPMEPEYRSYKQFEEILPPDPKKYTKREINFKDNPDLAIGYMVSIQMECAEYFKLHYNKFEEWAEAKPGYVKAVIYNLSFADIKAATNEYGEEDIVALVDLAVARSYSEGEKLYQTVSHPNNYSKKKKKNYVPNPWLTDFKRTLVRQYKEAKRRLAWDDGQERFEKAWAEYERKLEQQKKEKAQDKTEVDAYNDRLQEEYEQRMKLWTEYEQNKDKPIPAVFRSFKQMVFSEGYDWRFEIDPMLISTWFLCYVFFELDRDYGTQSLDVCMGTSSGQDNWKKNKEKASQIILTVYDLIENVFNHDRDNFDSMTIDELKKVTEIKEFSQTAKDENHIWVFPEAYANLHPLAKQKRFGTGVNAVVDIGGGTTDISIFIAPPSKKVKTEIFDYVSIPYGVNAIDKKGKEIHFDAVNKTINKLSRDIIYHAYSVGVKQSEAAEIVSKRPIVYTGGGSMIPELRRQYQGFTDIIHNGEPLLDKYSFFEADEIREQIPMLSTALGLALCENNDESIPLIITYEILFETVEERHKGQQKNNDFDYEHGVSQW